MKIITRFESIWNAALGRYVTSPGSEQSFDYEGPIARCDLGGGKMSSTTVNTIVPPKTATELAVDKLTLEQLQRQAAISKEMDPIARKYLLDYSDEQAVRSGGKVADVMKATPWAKQTLAQITADLRKDTKYLKSPAVAAAKAVIDPVTKKVITKATKAKAAVFDVAAINAEAKRRVNLREELDTEATAARTKQFTDVIESEKVAKERTEAQAARAEEIAQLQLEAIKNPGKPTAEQLDAINAATGAAQTTGEADIERFRTDTLRQINEEVASASGLRPTDTPILRLSERAGEESARQHGILTSRLAETNATARLNFPLASAKLTSDIAAGQQSLAFASQQFQEQLKRRAEDNRFRLFAAGNPNYGSPSSFGATLANERFATASRTSNMDTNEGLNFAGIGQFAGGVGGLMQGAKLFSDRRLKRDILHIGALLSGIPVYAFRYIGFEDWHIGCLADEVVKVFPEAVFEHESGFLVVDYAALH